MTLIAEKKITIAEFLERDDFEEGYIYELINGEIMRRTSPHTRHQDISSELNALLRNFIKPNQLGKIYPAPTDVYLSDDTDLVVPDLNFIATKNLHKVQPSGFILGAPDIIIEILSKSTKHIDRGDKKERYEYFEVPEYWIVDPVAQSIEVYVLQKGKYKLTSFAEEIGTIQSSVLVGFSLEVAEVFN